MVLDVERWSVLNAAFGIQRGHWNLLVLSHTLVVTTLMFSRYLWRCRATRKNYAANQWTRDEENPRANQEGKKIYSCECQLVSIIVVLFPPWIVFKDTVCTVAAHSPWLGFPIHSSRTDTSSRWLQVTVGYVHLIHTVLSISIPAICYPSISQPHDLTPQIRRAHSNTRTQSVRRTSIREKTLTPKKEAQEEARIRLQLENKKKALVRNGKFLCLGNEDLLYTPILNWL